jgi:hypothetical protein
VEISTIIFLKKFYNEILRLNMPNKELLAGLYLHYKGQEYEVIEVARHSETQEWVVVYRCLYGDYSLWVRPYDMFVEAIVINDVEVPRFQYLGACRA